MERNIVTTIKFSSKKIVVNCIENITSNYVEIFSNTSNVKLKHEKIHFIKESIASINKIIDGKIKSVFVVITNDRNIGLKIRMIEKEIKILNNKVTQTDVDKVINLTNEPNKKDSQTVNILVQPIRYEVFNFKIKSYNRAPIGKEGNTLKIKAAISSINKAKFDEISTLIKEANVNITQILTSSHVLPHQTLSSGAIIEGAISIHLGKSKTFLAVMANAALIKSKEIPFGFDILLSKIAELFGCSIKKATHLVKVYGCLDGDDSIIFIKHDGLITKEYDSKTLSIIIKQFLKKLLLLSKAFIDKKEVLSKLSVVFSGEVEKIFNIEDYAKEFFENEYISTYSSLSYIASNIKDLEALGVFNFIEKYDSIMGNNFNTLVETNPDKIISLHYRKTKMFANLLN